MTREASLLQRYLAFKDKLIPDLDQVLRGLRTGGPETSRLRRAMARLVLESSELEKDPGDVAAFLASVATLEALAEELERMGYPARPAVPPPVEGYEDLYEVAKVMEE